MAACGLEQRQVCHEKTVNKIDISLVSSIPSPYLFQMFHRAPHGIISTLYNLSKLPNGIRQNRVTRPDIPAPYPGSPVQDSNCQRAQQTSHTVSISYNYGALSEYGSPLSTKEEDRIVFEYVPDPSKDMFHVGRVASNDFIVKGPLHYDSAMVTCGPVSRYACRIEVERRAPFRASVFAAGFNTSKVSSAASTFSPCLFLCLLFFLNDFLCYIV